jgi:hypothetical protein
MGFLLSFGLKHLDKIVIVLLVAAVLGFTYVSGRKHERQNWKPKYDALVTSIETARVQAEAEKAAAVAAAKETNERVVAHLQERVQANAAAADAVRSELRRARAGSQLKPAESAPAACRDFEADRTKLPAADQDFLVDIGKRCDETAITLKSCQTYAVELHGICSSR